MPNKDKNIPKRRFKEFENADAWELRKLGELAEIVRGASPRPIQDPKWFDEQSEIGWLRISDVTEQDGRIYHLEQKISKLGQQKTRVLVEPHLLLSIAATVGKPVVNYVKTGVHDGFLIFLEPCFEQEFMFQWLEMFRSYWSKYGQPGSQVNLNSDLVKKQELSIPTLPEQETIGTFFSSLDRHITLHQRKLDKLKSVKQAYLSEIFPAEGERVPKRRFPGFTDAWELRKLNEVSDIYDGTHQTPKYQDDGVMFLSVENIKTLTSNKFISREAFEVEFKIRPQRGDVLMTRIGDIGTANVVETDEDLAYYVSLALFKSEELNPYFLQASIYAPFVQDQIWKRTLHIAFPKKINKNEIGQVPINVPTLAEQTKIGSFFKQLDNTITLHQRKLDKLKSVKQAYLSEMFPAEGERMPKRRFPGFTDDWELRKLGEISTHRGGTAIENHFSEDGKYKVISIGSYGLDNKYIDQKIRAVENEVTRSKVVNKNELTMVLNDKTANGNIIGRCLLIEADDEFVINQRTEIISFNSVIYPKFAYVVLNGAFREQVKKIVQGGTQIYVNYSSVEQLYLSLPTLPEQEAIGNFFSTLDRHITLHQRKSI